MRGCRAVFSLASGVAAVLLLASLGSPDDGTSSPNTVESRVAKLLSSMTVDEKLDMLSGTGFDSRPLPRLGIPAMHMTDGPAGVAGHKSTAFPAGVSLAASWDPLLVEEVGKAIAQEVRAQGKNVLLAPTVNIHRVPQDGRNFESFGEDPYLAARIAAAYVRGVQSQKVIATVKHFVCNNQETDRMKVDVRVDERTLHEIYLPAFKAAVQEGGAWALMSAYNRVNGQYASENHTLLTDILKAGWGFKGFVMSDWGAVHSTVPTVNAGLDIEMPGGQFLTREALQAALTSGEIDIGTVDDKVRRMLRAMMSAGLFDAEQDPGSIDTPEHRELNRRAAASGIVLLANNGILPIVRTASQGVLSIAVIGPNAAVARTGGGGSSYVTPTYAVSPLDGLRKALPGFRVEYEPGAVFETDLTPIPSDELKPPEGTKGGHKGLLGEYFKGQDLAGNPVLQRVDPEVSFEWGANPPAPEVPADHYSVRWSGQLIPKKSGRYVLGVRSDDGSRLYLDGKLLVDNWGNHGAVTRTAAVSLLAHTSHEIRLEYYEDSGGASILLGWRHETGHLLDDAVALAKHSDAAIVCAGFTGDIETEGTDRPLALPDDQDKLISQVVAANKNTIVVLYSGAAVTLGPWVHDAAAILEAWYPGQEDGNALADVLTGQVNPSARLPTTFLAKWEDSPAYGHYPGQNDTVEYAEGIFVGYRYFESKRLPVLFPFGYGLSYTNFAYSDLHISPKAIKPNEKMEVSFSLRNTGRVPGAEIVQLYIRDAESSLPRPPKELKGFQKVTLQPGELQTVRFDIDKSKLSFYDPSQHAWVAEPGEFEVLIGGSSNDIWLRGGFSLE